MIKRMGHLCDSCQTGVEILLQLLTSNTDDITY